MRQFKMQTSAQKITKTREKNVATNENCMLRKMNLKFQKSSNSILCKNVFWNKQT